MKPRKVYLGDDTHYNAIGRGFVIAVSDAEQQSKIQDVLYVPGIAHNLLSVSKLIDNGIQVEFMQNKCQLSKDGKTSCNCREERQSVHLTGW